MARQRQWSRAVWKMIAIVALSAAVLQTIVGIYVVFAFKSNIDVLAESAPVCYAGMADFDSIAAAQAIGRLDLVSFLLTTGGVLLGIFSLIGFWIIRREAMEEARDAAIEEARKFLVRFTPLEENGEGTYNRTGGEQVSRAKEQKARKAFGLNIPRLEDVPTAGAERDEPGDAK